MEQIQKPKINPADYIGGHVCIEILGMCWIDGILTGVTEDTLTLKADSGEVNIPRRDVGMLFPPHHFDANGKLKPFAESWVSHYPKESAEKLKERLPFYERTPPYKTRGI